MKQRGTTRVALVLFPTVVKSAADMLGNLHSYELCRTEVTTVTGKHSSKNKDMNTKSNWNSACAYIQ